MAILEHKSLSDLAEFLAQYTIPQYMVWYVLSGKLDLAPAKISMYSPKKCVSMELDSACIGITKSWLDIIIFEEVLQLEMSIIVPYYVK